MNTIELACERLGSQGPHLLILHGLFGCGRNWRGIARELENDYRILLPDLRNHGASGHSPDMDYPHLAADLIRLLDAGGIESATVIGHSMGGKVATWLALTEPQRVASVVAVDIAPVAYQHNFDDIIAAMRNLPVDQIKNRTEAHDQLAESIPEEGLRQFLLQNLVSENGRYRWRIDLEIIGRAMPLLLGFPSTEYRTPYRGDALFLGGARSRYLLTDYHAAISQICPNTQIEIIQDAGHWVQVDQREHFLARLKQFLDALNSSK